VANTLKSGSSQYEREASRLEGLEGVVVSWMLTLRTRGGSVRGVNKQVQSNPHYKGEDGSWEES